METEAGNLRLGDAGAAILGQTRRPGSQRLNQSRVKKAEGGWNVCSVAQHCGRPWAPSEKYKEDKRKGTRCKMMVGGGGGGKKWGTSQAREPESKQERDLWSLAGRVWGSEGASGLCFYTMNQQGPGEGESKALSGAPRSPEQNGAITQGRVSQFPPN